MKIRTTEAIIFGFVSMLFASCGSVKVVSYQTPDTDFSAYSSYSILSNEYFSANNIQERDKLESAIINEMDNRGFMFAEKPDLIIGYQIVLGAETRVRNDQQFFPFFGNFYRFNTIDVDRYNEGILMVEVRQKKKVLWQGSLDLRYNSRSKTKKDIHELIALIFREFPSPVDSTENLDN